MGATEIEKGIQSRVLEQAAESCIPLTLMIETTQVCNFRCVHCYNFDRTAPHRTTPRNPTDYLHLDEICRILVEGRGLGCLTLCLTGGEVLLDPRLMSIVREAKKLSYAVRLKSNASIVTEVRAKELAKNGVSDCEVSVYGSNQETYQAFTGRSEQYQKVREGIKNLVRAGIVTTINLILHKGNYQQFQEMKAMSGELGADYQVSLDLTQRYDGTRSSLDWRLGKKELRELYLQNPELYENSFNDTGSLNCGCGRVQIAVASNGKVYPCMGAPIECGNIRKQSLKEIWEKSETMNWLRGLTPQNYEECQECPTRRFCQRSSGSVYSNTGNYTGKVEWNCMQAELIRDISLAKLKLNPKIKEFTN